MISAAALILMAAMFHVAPASAGSPKRVDGEVCYDQLVIGTVTSYIDGVSLSDLTGEVWLGARYDLEVRVDEVLEGARLPGKITVRATMTSQHKTPVEMLFYVQWLDDGVYWAPDWLPVRRDSAGRQMRSESPPPRCTS